MITCVGEILVDKLVKGDTAVCHVGGAPFNVAVGAARCGADVAFFGKVGADEAGRFLLREAAGFGIDAHVAVDPVHPTTIALVTLDEGGERSFRFLRQDSADYRLYPADLAAAPATTILHLGTLMLNKAIGREFATYVVDYSRQNGLMLSVDANFRDDLFATTALRNEVMLPYLQAADILKMSADELTDLAGTDDLDEAVRWLRPKGLLFVTAGSAASRAYMGGYVVSAQPQPLAKVVDTTGAGDAFYGAVLAGLDSLYSRGLQPSLDDLRELLEVANRCGAAATQHEGAI